jgi:hypothetical protein
MNNAGRIAPAEQRAVPIAGDQGEELVEHSKRPPNTSTPITRHSTGTWQRALIERKLAAVAPDQRTRGLSMRFMITKKWNGAIDRRSPVTSDEALDAIAWARGQANVIVEITDEHGKVVSKTQLKKSSKG